MDTTIFCPNCGYENRVGLFFCENCAHPLSEDGTVMSKPEAELRLMVKQMFPTDTPEGDPFSQESRILLYVQDAEEPISLKPDVQTILGRRDTNVSRKVDIDLTPYGALRKGVSRFHAMIYFAGSHLYLIDMVSGNGTYLNGTRLAPNSPYPISDADEIRLGKLIMHVYFKG